MAMIRGKYVCVDFEGTGVRVIQGEDKPFAVSLCNEHGDVVYREWKVDPETRKVWVPRDDRDELRELFSDPSRVFIGHNTLRIERQYAEAIGAPMIANHRNYFDTMIAAQLCNSGEFSHQLKPLCLKYLKEPVTDEEELTAAVKRVRLMVRNRGWKIAYKYSMDEDGNVKKKPLITADYWMPETFIRLFPEEAKAKGIKSGLCRVYCVGDTQRRAWPLFEMYNVILDKMGLRKLFEKEQRLAIECVSGMEKRGVRVSRKICRTNMRECYQIAADHKKTIVKYAGTKFNANSHQQKCKILFSKLGLKPLVVTKKGNPSVNKEALSHYTHHPFVRALLERDRAIKAAGFYRLYLREMVWCEEERCWKIHPSFFQMGAGTGRFSCRDPNLQNVPKRADRPDDVMLKVREPFGPRPGYVWYHFDYKGMEARLWADEAQDQTLLELFARDEDPYEYLVEQIRDLTGINLVSVYAKRQGGDKAKGKKQARQICKNNFLGKLYGELAAKLASQYPGMSEEQGGDVVKAMLRTFTRIDPYMWECKQEALETGGVRNRYGRFIAVVQNAKTGKGGLHASVNYRIQSDGADLIKAAMLKLAKQFRKWRKTGKAVCYISMQIHDELVIEIRKGDDKPWVIRRIAEIMSDNDGMFPSVKTPVDCKKTTRFWNRQEEVPIPERNAA